MDGDTAVGVRGVLQEPIATGMHETQAVRLPTYESLQTSNPPPGFTNPRYGAEEMGDVVEGVRLEERRGEGEDIDDDFPPPYSPGIVGRQEVYVAPPEYFAIFGQIREAREESTSHFVFLRKLCQIFLNTIGCTVLLLIFMSIPIAVLVLGVYFLGDCPTEPKIPIFLVVGGTSGALKNIALVFENIIKRMSHRFSIDSVRRLRYAKFTWRVINLVFDLFLLAWIIAGSYWVYHIYREVDPDYKECHETLYKVAFGVITSSYILFTLMCCCMCVCGLCLIQRQSGEQEGSDAADDRTEGEGERSLRGESGSPMRHSHSPSPRSGGDRETGSPEGDDGGGNSLRPRNSRTPEREDTPRRPHDTSSTAAPPTAGDGSRRHVPPALSLDNLESVEMVDYQYTPVLSPRSRQLAANEQETPLSPRTTSV